MISLVLFDIDGTLIRTGGAGVKAFARAFQTEFQLARATAGVNFAGRTDTSLVRQCFRLHRVPESRENFSRFFDAYVFWLDHLLTASPGTACPAVADSLRALQALPEPPVCGLLTGNIRLGAEIKLRHHGLWEHFRMGAFGDDHEDRNCLASVARERGGQWLARKLSGEEILVIGDTPLDIECARAIGAKSLAVATGGHTLDELRAHHPTWLSANLTEADWAAMCR